MRLFVQLRFAFSRLAHRRQETSIIVACVCVCLPGGIESRANTRVRLFPRWSWMNEWADSDIDKPTAACVCVSL